MRHQVVNPGIQANFIDRNQALGAKLIIQITHFGSDIGRGHEMRTFRQTGFGNADVVVRGQHRNRHIAGLQRRCQRVQCIGPDIGGDIADRLDGLGDSAVPHHHRMAVLNQPPQSGCRGQASATPMNGHRLTPSDHFNMAEKFRMGATPDSAVYRPQCGKRGQKLGGIILRGFDRQHRGQIVDSGDIQRR